MSHCGILILAAGESRRLGRRKQLLPIAGTTLLRRSVQSAIDSICRPIIVVTGCDGQKMKEHLADLPVTVMHNPAWESGMGTSVAAGVAALAKEKCDAVCILMCDQPMVTSASINRLVAQQHESGKLICSAAYNGTLGPPAIFAASLFDELLNLPPNEGGKSIIRRHPDEMESVEMPEAAMDIDTEADWLRLSQVQDRKLATDEKADLHR